MVEFSETAAEKLAALFADFCLLEVHLAVAQQLEFELHIDPRRFVVLIFSCVFVMVRQTRLLQDFISIRAL